MGEANSKAISHETAADTTAIMDIDIVHYRKMYLKCCDKLTSKMKKVVFHDVVVGGLFPAVVGDFLFSAFGGTNDSGISFDNLVRGILSISKRSDDWQAIRTNLMFRVVANAQSEFVNKQKLLGLFKLTESAEGMERIRRYFDDSLAIDFDMFNAWVNLNSESYILTSWFFSEVVPGFNQPPAVKNDAFAVPTLYGTIAKITHLHENEIELLEKHFATLCGASRVSMDYATFESLVCPPIADEITRGFFNSFDSNRDGIIDFKEYAYGVSACCRGPKVERRKFLFRMFDFDNDGMLSRVEVFNLADICIRIQIQFASFSSSNKLRSGSVYTESPDIVNDIMNQHDPDHDSFIQLDDFLIWSEKTEVLTVFSELLEQMCHIVFGLKPTSPEEEGLLLRRFIKREKSFLLVGSKWYIIPQSWWLSWIEHTTCSDQASPHFGVTNGSVIAPAAENSNTTTFPNYKSASASNSPLISRKNQKIVPSLRRKEHMYTVNPLPSNANRQSVLGAIDTTKLLTKDKLKAPQLTSEEILRSESEGKIECIPAAVWKCLITWYGCSGPAIQRHAIRDPSRTKGVKIETHPLLLNIYQHAPKSPSIHSLISQQVSATFNSLPIPNVSNVFSQPQSSSNLFNATTPSFKRVLSKTVVLSQASTIDKIRNLFLCKMNIRSDEIRLWHFRTEDCLILLRDESTTLYEAGIQSGDSLLVELRHVQGWPEVLLQNNYSNGSENDDTSSSVSANSAQVESRAGQAGLHNIGNTCFMNSALQCLSHTYALTTYFLSNKHFYEINMKNSDGSKGQVALCYGHLIHQLWSSNNSVVRPSIIRDAIIKHRTQFNNSNQHDAQEMLEAILDLLHEDLNRVTHQKSYQTLAEAEGREDRDVADEQWTAHLKNNNSIICDLFSGQMQSKMTCATCSRSTSKFDVFNVLSLSIPSDQMSLIYILLHKLDGNPPTRFAMRVARRAMTYGALKKDFAFICNLDKGELVFVEYNKVMPSMPGAMLEDSVKLKNHCSIPNSLLAFQCTLYVNGSTPSQTPLIETPSVSNDSLTTVDSRALANHSSSQFNKLENEVTGTRDEQSFCSQSSHNHSTSEATNANAVKVEKEVIPNGVHTSEADDLMASPIMNGGVEKDAECGSSLSNNEIGATDNGKGGSGLLSPNATGVPLTPSSSGYASDTWRAATENCFIFAVHSKPTPNSVYFLWENRSKATIFGFPVLVPLPSGVTNADVYNVVENQISRLITASPMEQYSNHAKDCDEKPLGSGCHLFSLRRVAYSGSSYGGSNGFGSPSYNQNSSNSLKCWNCPWNKVCKGCIVESNDKLFELPPRTNSCSTVANETTTVPSVSTTSNFNCTAHNTLYFLAIEWDITTLHLRYKFSAEKEYQEHKSVADCEKAQKQNLSLDDCLSLLVKEQTITDFSACPKCKSTKITLSHHIWRAPPTLIIHLKRYEQPSLNGSLRWIKCHRKIIFPVEYLNMLPFVSPGAHQLNKEFARINSGMHPVDVSSFSETENTATGVNNNCFTNGLRAECIQEAEKNDTEEQNSPDVDKFKLDEYFNYRLFSVSCHSGNLSNGHYVSVCRNPLNQKWFCFDDNTCKEVPVSSLPLETTYLLFYELSKINIERFLPTVDMKQPIINPTDFQSNPASFLSSSSDNRRNCFIQ